MSATDPGSLTTADILIVDDGPDNLKVLGDLLESEGFRVRPVPNGELALSVAEKKQPDLVLLDIMMPGMDGYEVCRRFKESSRLNDIPIIFISALNDADDIIKGLNSGGVDYISKPFHAGEVLARVNTHIRLHRQNRELLELNATKDKIFSIISHDLRGPFFGFLGLTQLLVEEFPDLSRTSIMDIVLNIRNSASNFYRLLENMLQWAQMQQGKVPFTPKKILLTTIVQDSILLSSESARAKEIDITVDIPDDIMILADINLLQSVIRNLLSNAVKFTHRGGKISISAVSNDVKTVQLSVRDSGIGMSREMVNNLFSLEVQSNRQGTEGEPSTGLGLIICRELIEKQGGELLIESEDGNGSNFKFTLPTC